MLSKETEENVKKNLEKAVQGGASLYLEGKRSTPDAVARYCVKEDMSYMPDYVWDDEGKLTEVRYNKIKHT